MRTAIALLTTAFGIYLLFALILCPVKPNFPWLNMATGLMNEFFQRMDKKPLLYPSQRKQIQSYLRGLDSQIEEGFASIDLSSHEDHRQTYRWPVTWRKTCSWWECNNQKKDEVSWFTPPLERKKNTTFIFSGALGLEDGKAELSIGEKPVLLWETGSNQENKIWVQDKYKLRFFPLNVFGYTSGIFCLTVPARDITAGKPVRITVRAKAAKSKYSYFLLHKYSDTCNLVNGKIEG